MCPGDGAAGREAGAEGHQPELEEEAVSEMRQRDQEGLRRPRKAKERVEGLRPEQVREALTGMGSWALFRAFRA